MHKRLLVHIFFIIIASTVYSVNHIPLRLTDERWRHIVGNHNDQAGYYFEVLETVAHPEAENFMAAATVVKEIFKALPHLKKVGAKNLWFDLKIKFSWRSKSKDDADNPLISKSQ